MGYTFRGSNYTICLFCPLFSMEYTFRESNSIICLFCLPFRWGTPSGEATLPLVCFASFFNGVHLQGKQLYHLFVLPPFSMGYTFRGSNSIISLFCLPFQWDTPSGKQLYHLFVLPPFSMGYTFRGSNSTICLFCLPFQWSTPLGEATLPFVCFVSLFNGGIPSGETTLPSFCFASLFNGIYLQGEQLYH